MSNPNYTHIVLLVDASGSMEPTKQATIDGINAFIETQKKVPDSAVPERNLSFEDDFSDSNKGIKCTATLAMFSGEIRPAQMNYGTINLLSQYQNMPATNGEPQEPYNYIKLYEEVDILSVPALNAQNYDTYGGTPLIDAFYRTIIDCASYINRLPENERPGRVIIISNTDGEENESKKFTKTQLRELITEKIALNWQFIYLGANQDAFSESGSYGVSAGQAMNYVPDCAGITRGYTALAYNVLTKRAAPVNKMTCCSIGDLDSSTGSINAASTTDDIKDMITALYKSTPSKDTTPKDTTI